MHPVHDSVHFPETNREHNAVVTTPRPSAHSSCNVAATHPSRGGLPNATRRHPADIEEDDKRATVVVPVTAPGCDVVGWVPSFDRFRMHPVHHAVHFPEMNGEHTAVVTTPRPNVAPPCDVAATHLMPLARFMPTPLLDLVRLGIFGLPKTFGAAGAS
jgi:hypothetical protein